MSEEVFNFEIVEENIIIPAGVVEIGPDGLSAYQVAVSRGYVGTVEEWLLSIAGEAADLLADDVLATATDRVQTGLDRVATTAAKEEAQAALLLTQEAKDTAVDAKDTAVAAAMASQAYADTVVQDMQYFFRTAMKYEIENHTH